jgi:hypothetical protein
MIHPLEFFFDYKVEYIIAPNELLIEMQLKLELWAWAKWHSGLD